MRMKKKISLRGYQLTIYQILHTSIIKIIQQTVRRITAEIFGVKGLRYKYPCSFTNHSKNVKLLLQCFRLSTRVFSFITCKSLINVILLCGCPVTLFWLYNVIRICACDLRVDNSHISRVVCIKKNKKRPYIDQRIDET